MDQKELPFLTDNNAYFLSDSGISTGYQTNAKANRPIRIPDKR